MKVDILTRYQYFIIYTLAIIFSLLKKQIILKPNNVQIIPHSHFRSVTHSFFLWFKVSLLISKIERKTKHAAWLTSLLLFSQNYLPTTCQQSVTAARWWTLQRPLCEKVPLKAQETVPSISHPSMKRGPKYDGSPLPSLDISHVAER